MHVTDDVRAVFDAWASRRKKKHPLGPEPRLDRKRAEVIQDRLREGFDVETLKLAVEGVWLDSWHLGDNDRGAEYCDIRHALGDAAKVEKFAEHKERVQPGRRPESKHIPMLQSPHRQQPGPGGPLWKSGDEQVEPQPELTPEQIAENKAKLTALMSDLSKKLGIPVKAPTTAEWHRSLEKAGGK